MSAIDLEGREYDWLACDRDRRVALFCTAGGGYAPDALVQDPDGYDAAIDAILSLAASTDVWFAPTSDGPFQDPWRLVAERGLFAYDSDAHGGPYHLVAVPEQAIFLDALPPAIAAVAGRIVLRSISFAGTARITAAMLAGV